MISALASSCTRSLSIAVGRPSPLATARCCSCSYSSIKLALCLASHTSAAERSRTAPAASGSRRWMSVGSLPPAGAENALRPPEGRRKRPKGDKRPVLYQILRSLKDQDQKTFLYAARHLRWPDMTVEHLERLIDALAASVPPLSSNTHAGWCKGVAQVVVSLHQNRPDLANGAPIPKLIDVALARQITGKLAISALAELTLSTNLSSSDSIPWRTLADLVARAGLVTLTKCLVPCIPSHTLTPLARIQLLATAAAASHNVQLVDQLVAQAIAANLVAHKWSDPQLVQSQLLAHPSTLDQFNLMYEMVQPAAPIGPKQSSATRPGLRAHHFSSLALALARDGHAELAWTVLNWMQTVSDSGTLARSLDAKVAHEIMQHMLEAGKYRETALMCQWLVDCNVATVYHLEVAVRALGKMRVAESPRWIAQLYEAAVNARVPMSVEFVTSVVKALLSVDRDGLREAMKVVREMKEKAGVVPNEVLYSVLLKRAIRVGDMDVQQEIMGMAEKQYHVQGRQGPAPLPIPIAFTLLVEPHLDPHSLDLHQALAAVAAIHSAHGPEALTIDYWSILMGTTTNLPPSASRLGAVYALHVLTASSVGGLTATSFSPYVGATISAVSRAGDHVLATRLIRSWVLGDSGAVEGTNWDPRAQPLPLPASSAATKYSKHPLFPNPKMLSVCADALGYASDSETLDALVDKIHTRRWKTDANVWASIVEAWLRMGHGERAIRALMVDRKRAGVRVVTAKVRGTVRSMVAKDVRKLGWVVKDERVQEVLTSARRPEREAQRHVVREGGR